MTGLDSYAFNLSDLFAFPNGGHIAEVEIDPETGVITLERYTVVDDYGCLINPVLTRGQVQGGVAQGIGQALFEHTVYDPGSGQSLSGSLMDYTLPRADDLPPLTSPSPSCQLPPIRLASKARVRPAASRRRRPSSTQSSTRSRHSASNISTCRPLLSGSGVRSAECDGDHPQSWPLCRFDADPITRGSASWNRGRPNGGGPCGREL